jgi:hypothetical protein
VAVGGTLGVIAGSAGAIAAISPALACHLAVMYNAIWQVPE